MTGQSPLVIDSRRLPRRPGASLPLTVHVDPDADLDSEAHLANDVVQVARAPVEVELLLESVLDGILVTGTASLRLEGTCVRCLADLDTSLDITFRPFFVYPGSEVEDNDESDDDIEPMDGPLLDLRPAFRDATLLALPLSPVCEPDCPGLCPDCGIRLADDPGHGHERSDPRLAALADLRTQLTESEGD